MNILLLEDNLDRINIFQNNLKDHNLICSSFAEECIDLLKNKTYDLIFLDHDLWDKEGYDPNNCGMQVAEYIRDNNFKTKVIVHSCNVPVAMKMTFMIPQASYIPNAWNYIWLILDGLK
jgi:CheY-like chemotaxis protein